MQQYKKWIFKRIPPKMEVDSLSRSLNINTWLASLLLQREISTFDKAKAFFRPKLSELYDPFLMKDMATAAERLTKAIAHNEKIMIYGDYDVDGTTAVSLVYGFLKENFPDNCFLPYIPDRYSEGYGISSQGIDYAFENNINLIISLDCGIRAIDKVKYANEKNIDFIICDHHEPGKKIPDAVAVLDPKQENCQYPYKELSGCGVGFKLMQAICRQNDIEEKQLFSFLDLLCISIASDIVPITGENRILCYHGMIQLNHDARPGLKALMKVAGFKSKLTVTNVVFGIGPRINAAGRINHGMGAVELLMSETEEQAQGIASDLDSQNQLRKDFDSSITKEAINLIKNDNNLLQAKSTVLFKEDWHKGVIGIVASRCIESYYRPTVILTQSNGIATGSARSVEGFDLYEAICECSYLLDKFGGHTHAAGLSLPVENIDAFRQKFEEVVRERVNEEILTPKLEIDLELPLYIINYKFYNIIRQMGPFGPQNMQPVFAAKNVWLNSNIKYINEEHIKFRVKQKDSLPFEVIGFGFASIADSLSFDQPFHIAFNIGENTYKGITTLQLYLKDIRFNE